MKSRSKDLEFVVRLVHPHYPWNDGDLVKVVEDGRNNYRCVPSDLNNVVEYPEYLVCKDHCELVP